ncbi:MAG: 4Fe-4S dicluster domain-containing protein [Armatimonadetes bacterium]|nr:4Fe-4S dicluster domain-containing protein [Armatimonadota bacterium]
MGTEAAATREVFLGLTGWMQGLFFLCMLGSLGYSTWVVWGRVRVWRSQARGDWERDPRRWVQRLRTEVLGQRRVRTAPRGRHLGAALHLCLFSGFLVLAVGTTLLFFADKGPVYFHRGWYYLVYEAVMDLFGLVFVIGCGLALYRRLTCRPPSLGHNRTDLPFLTLFLAVGLTGFLLEGTRIALSAPSPEIARWSFVGSGVGRGLRAAGLESLYLPVWWLHVALITALFALWPHTRLIHALTGTLHILLRPEHPTGRLEPVSLQAVEESGRVGLQQPADLTGVQRLSLDACMECGRCEDACPAFATGKPLSPKRFVQDLKAVVDHGRPSLHEPTILPETLWACTSCQACVSACPVRIGHVDLLVGMRRHLVGEGRLTGPPAQSLRRLAGQGNPFGKPQRERLNWAEGLGVRTLEEFPEAELLLWVGCAASFDPRAQRVARATVQLLQRAGVGFAVLGRAERCTGDPARRLGDDFLYQELAAANAPALAEFAGDPPRRRIVTPCPHCLNTLRHEYGAHGASLEVVHHSQFLMELVEKGRLRRTDPQSHPKQATLHDPCYLARVNGEVEATRGVLSAAGWGISEMPRNREQTFCCGAGGGRMWFEEPPTARVNRQRAQEAVGTGASTLATACPFCVNMMTDGVAGVDASDALRVADVAELLWEAQENADTTAKVGTGAAVV